jgi:hypothetical protein
MDFLDKVFDVFSRRSDHPHVGDHQVPTTTRGRVLMWCDEVFGNERRELLAGADYRADFWEDVHRHLRFNTGRPALTSRSNLGPTQDAMSFLAQCSGPEFLDFLEYVFRVAVFSRLLCAPNMVVEELNRLLRLDELPYALTAFVEETRIETRDTPFGKKDVTTKLVVAYPKVIMRESEAMYLQAVAPALILLSNPVFKNANSEYVGAHEDYRRGDYRDCLTKCGSSLESVLKICFHRKKWPYSEKDTAQVLIQTLIANTTLDPYFKEPIMIVATLRNRLSSSHGAGVTPKTPERHLARYALNSTAAAILLITDELKES